MSTSLKKFTPLVWVIIRAPFSAWETDFLFKSREGERKSERGKIRFGRGFMNCAAQLRILTSNVCLLTT